MVNGLADYVHATLSDGEGNVPRIPPYHVGGGPRLGRRALRRRFPGQVRGCAYRDRDLAENADGRLCIDRRHFTLAAHCIVFQFRSDAGGAKSDGFGAAQFRGSQQGTSCCSRGGMPVCSFGSASNASVAGSGMHDRCMPLHRLHRFAGSEGRGSDGNRRVPPGLVKFRLNGARFGGARLGVERLCETVQRPAFAGVACQIVAVDDLGLRGPSGAQEFRAEHMPHREEPVAGSS